ncbi:MAG: hypothetical protein JWO25_2116, partial [Alphaproteobacteria bacterium]|nr:hypothetical protein [Alphaproteobacteria bacterium]
MGRRTEGAHPVILGPQLDDMVAAMDRGFARRIL